MTSKEIKDAGIRTVRIGTVILITIGVAYIMYKTGYRDSMVRFQRNMIDDMLKHINVLEQTAGILR